MTNAEEKGISVRGWTTRCIRRGESRTGDKDGSIDFRQVLKVFSVNIRNLVIFSVCSGKHWKSFSAGRLSPNIAREDKFESKFRMVNGRVFQMTYLEVASFCSLFYS